MSFCRSGNTFLRKYLEMITMTPTGSEMPLTVAHGFQTMCMIGEQIVDDRCWIIKTHHPIPKLPGNLDFTANKILICVRNPFDMLVSYCTFISTCSSQSAQLANDFYGEEFAFFEEFISVGAGQLKMFMDSCKELIEKGKLVHFIKFEELRENT